MPHLQNVHDREIHDRRFSIAYSAGLVLLAAFLVAAIGFGFGWW